MDSPLNRLPGATYRLQFNKGFRFADAKQIVEYLKALGISDVYASPLFLAGPESTHGYDVCAFDELNPALGATEEFHQLVESLRERDMGVLLDMVPNHMGADSGNPWWQDVLKHGENSRYAAFFDINWSRGEQRKVLLPVLGDRYGEVLRRGELKLARTEGTFFLTYFDKTFPIAPGTIDDTISDDELNRINTSADLVHPIVQKQHYRLAYWRVGPAEINYRRFFDVTGLVSVRVEDQAVFEATHQFLFALLEHGHITGLRIDHPDGLRDPKTYFDRLQQGFQKLAADQNLYVVAEKILSDEERLPMDWAVCGTTGYDYLIYQNGIFVAGANERSFTEFYKEFTGELADYGEVALDAKREVLEQLFPGDVIALTQRLRHLAKQSIEGLDLTEDELREAIIQLICALPVYRTYARAGKREQSATDAAVIRQAASAAAQRSPKVTTAIRFAESVLLLHAQPDEEALEFTIRCQQLSGPATAKGLEDTAFYRYVRFVSLNEVGGNPGRFGINVEAFHAFNQSKSKSWPHSQLATSTHDTKRGEDVRARLNVLSEMPELWREHVQKWHQTGAQMSNRPKPTRNDEYLIYQTLVGSWPGPRPFDERQYLERIEQYLQKALREAKTNTSWTDPNADYEKVVHQFVEDLWHAPGFLNDWERFSEQVAYFGRFNSLAQVLLKIGSPGVPDFYQGTEFWDFSLVDPDNRRPVDYELRKEALQQVKSRAGKEGYLKELLGPQLNPELKLFVIWKALQFREAHSHLLEYGAYLPLTVVGDKSEYAIAFAREHHDERLVIVVPRLPFTLLQGATELPLGDVWGNTYINIPAQGRGRELFSGRDMETLRLRDVLRDFPLALIHYGSTTR